MTEFLIFLGLCAVFSFLFWRFLKMPNSEQRIKAQAAKEHAELRARVKAEDIAKAGGFGRKAAGQPITKFRPSGNQFPMEDYDGVPEDSPFGEDIDRPESRTIPRSFVGSWAPKSGRDMLIFEPNSYQYMSVLGMQPVVAVRHISESEIAVVSQQREDGKWTYCAQYFGLIDDGATLTDLENMDKKWVRA